MSSENARPAPHLVLAGDIGGTKTNLAILQVIETGVSHEFVTIRKQRYPSSDYSSLNAILREFFADEKRPIVSACFGVPGPVKGGRVKPTNLTWAVDAREIQEEFPFHSVKVINDLLANAYGIAELKPSDFEQLNPSAVALEGNRAVCSPGTGLGQAGLFWDGKTHRPWPSEGGHTDFAPRNSTEIALLEFLMKEFGHVSYERILCGQGLENVYRFLRDTSRGVERPEIAAEMKKRDPAAVISGNALEGRCLLCVQALELFVQILGAEAGNQALKCMAVGGVYLGGGIPAKILPKLRTATFLHAFTDKGRLSGLMQGIPVFVVLNDDAAVLGAARQAFLGSSSLL